MEMVSTTSLEFDRELYPRMGVSEFHVGEILRVMEGGHELPPVIADRRTRKLVDGAHRWHAAIKKQVEEIAVDWRDYEDDGEMFKDACLLNSAHGLNFTTQDRLKVIEIGQKFGLREIDFSMLLRTSPSYIQAIMPRVAYEPGSAPERVRRVPLKASTRHLSGQTITPQQADAIRGSAPGTSYLLVVRQVISALENDLFPPKSGHPVLWQELGRLRDLLAAVLSAAAG